MRVTLLMLLIAVSSSAYAKVLFYGSERENVSLSPGVSTILRFDEEVKTITQASDFSIKPADPENPDYRMLAVKPLRSKASNNVTFILANDVVINARLQTVRSKLHEKTNTFYDFKAKSLQIDPISKAGKGANVSEVELMKAMIRGDRVVGYNVRALSQKVRSGTEGIEARLLKVYSGPKYHGYIFEVTNTEEKKSYALDVKSLTLGRPNVAVLSQADQNILHPKDGERSTILRIVAKPTSVYYAVTLPVAPIIQQ